VRRLSFGKLAPNTCGGGARAAIERFSLDNKTSRKSVACIASFKFFGVCFHDWILGKSVSVGLSFLETNGAAVFLSSSAQWQEMDGNHAYKSTISLTNYSNNKIAPLGR
jgi:hypothetical protein